MTAHALTPGLRAAIAAGKHLETKEDQSLAPILQAVEELTKTSKARFDDLELKERTLNEQVAELGQKLASRSGAGFKTEPRSWGQQFVAAEEVKQFCKENSENASARRGARISLQMKST